MWVVVTALAFLSDHEGVGALYSPPLPADGLPTTTDLRRHTDIEFYVRHATSDGRRVVFQCGGGIWRWDGVEAAPIEHRARRRAQATCPADRCRPPPRRHRPGRRRAGQRRRGARHRLVGYPPRRPGARPGLGLGGRRRLPVVLASGGDVAWVTDAEGDDAVECGAAADDTVAVRSPGAVSAGCSNWSRPRTARCSPAPATTAGSGS